MPENLTLKGSETVNRHIVERPFPRGVFFFFFNEKCSYNGLLFLIVHILSFQKLGMFLWATLGIMVKTSVILHKVELSSNIEKIVIWHSWA